MAQLNRRSFLKFLSVSPAIFQALPALAFSKKPETHYTTNTTENILNKPLSTSVGTGMVIISYPGKPTMAGGTVKYNAETNQTVHTFTQSGTLQPK